MGSLNTLKYEQGPLRKILDPWKRVSEMVFAGGALGINLMMLDLWQLVLGGFWNLILGYQAYDLRTPSFWSLSVVKKRNQKLHPRKNPISQAQLSACFLCSHANPLFVFPTFPINKQIQIVMFGKFQVGQFDF